MPKPLDILVAVNTTSGQGRAEKYRTSIARALSKYTTNITWVEAATASECLTNLKQQIAHNSFDAVLVAGGDGMIHLGIQALANTQIPLGIIAVGSGNDIAREFGLPVHRVHRSIGKIMHSLLTQSYLDVDLMHIETKNKSAYAFAIASAGIDAHINLIANQSSSKLGNLRYAKAIIPGVWNFIPYGVEVIADNYRTKGGVTLLSIANTRYFGGGLKVAPMAKPSDGLLDLVIANGASFGELVGHVGRLALATHLRDARVHHRRAKEILLRPAPECGAKPPILMADGEEIGELPAKITVCPQSLRLAI